MSGQDLNLLIPAGDARTVQMPGEFIYAKSVPGKIHVIVDGKRVEMEAGDKARLPKAFREFIVENRQGTDQSVTFVVGFGDYNRQIVQGTISAVPYVITQRGSIVDARREMTFEIAHNPAYTPITWNAGTYHGAYKTFSVYNSHATRCKPVAASPDGKGGYLFAADQWTQIYRPMLWRWHPATDQVTEIVPIGSDGFGGSNNPNVVGVCVLDDGSILLSQNAVGQPIRSYDASYVYQSAPYTPASPWIAQNMALISGLLYWSEYNNSTGQRRIMRAQTDFSEMDEIAPAGQYNVNALFEWGGHLGIYDGTATKALQIDATTMQPIKTVDWPTGNEPSGGIYGFIATRDGYKSLTAADWGLSNFPLETQSWPAEIIVRQSLCDASAWVAPYRVTADVTVSGDRLTGEVIRALWQAVTGQDAPANYLDHVYALSAINGPNASQRVVSISEGSRSWASAQRADDVTLTLPARVTITTDYQF